nr:WASH complex subunit 3 [Leptinotarsa decemlineata]
MQVDEFPDIDPNEDLTKILPIQQKRTIAFVNHFIMDTVSHLNKFAQSCESRFMQFEYKVQKIEASLLILESQLSSISGLDNSQNSFVQNNSSEASELELPEVTEKAEEKPSDGASEAAKEADVPITDVVRAKEDPRFRKFFKMVQFGVPPPAVKLKMQNEGYDPNILDTPEAVIPGFREDLLKNESDEKSE